MIFSIDYNDPMNGIIKYLRTKNKSDYVSATESSYATSLEPASYLLKHETTSHFRFGINQLGEYFEVHFLKGSFVSLIGYGILATTQNCNIQRNWNVSCMSTNPPILLANEINNDSLCPGAGGPNCNDCTTNEKKLFDINKRNIKCSDIRFTTTGRSSYTSDRYWFSIAGIELFGTIGAYDNIFFEEMHL